MASADLTINQSSVWFLLAVAILAFFGGLVGGLALMMSFDQAPTPIEAPTAPDPVTVPEIKPSEPIDVQRQAPPPLDKPMGRWSPKSAIA